LPDEIKKFITQGHLSEFHLRQILGLSLKLYFSPWLTTEQAQIELAEKGKGSKTRVKVISPKNPRVFGGVFAKGGYLKGEVSQVVSQSQKIFKNLLSFCVSILKQF